MNSKLENKIPLDVTALETIISKYSTVYPGLKERLFPGSTPTPESISISNAKEIALLHGKIDKRKNYNNTYNTNNITNSIRNTNVEPLRDVRFIRKFRETLGEMEGGSYMSHFDINRKKKALLELVKRINFNKEHPENHNFYVANAKLRDYLVLLDDGWLRTIDNETLIDHINFIKSEFLRIVEEMVKDGKITESEINLQDLKEDFNLNKNPTTDFLKSLYRIGYEYKTMVERTKKEKAIEEILKNCN